MASAVSRHRLSRGAAAVTALVVSSGLSLLVCWGLAVKFDGVAFSYLGGVPVAPALAWMFAATARWSLRWCAAFATASLVLTLAAIAAAVLAVLLQWPESLELY